MRSKLLVAAAVLALVSGVACFTIRPKVVPYIPDPANAMPPEQARSALVDIMTRAKAWAGGRLDDVRADERGLHYGIARPRSPTESVSVDIPYADASVLITKIDSGPMKASGSYGVAIRKAGTADLETAFYFSRLEDAQAVSDLVGALADAAGN